MEFVLELLGELLLEGLPALGLRLVFGVVHVLAHLRAEPVRSLLSGE